MSESYPSSVPIMSSDDISRAREHARSIISRAGFGEREEVRLVTIVSELTRNILKYAGTGQCDFEVLLGAGRRRIRCTCRDAGPGIYDVDAALTDGYSTGQTLGGGLPGVKRLADRFHIDTGPDGTVVEIEVESPAA